ncbi:MAG: phage tail protein [Peptococcaceae bacterium]|nr:phage tail protein [Peptococcaceae bacterium]
MGSPQIGMKNLVYAIQTQDDSLGVAYNSPVALAESMSAKIAPKINAQQLWADDGLSEVLNSLGEIAVELDVKDLSLTVQAALLGHTVINGVITKKSTDIAPYVAIGFKSVKSNGKYRYIWLLKGTFEVQEIDAETQNDKPKFQNPKLKGTFMKRAYDDAWMRQGDEDLNPSVGTGWFTNVESGTPSALTVAQTPAASANLVTWTYNNAIDTSAVNDSHFFVMKAGVNVTGTLAIDATKKIVTFVPGTAMSGAHIAVASKAVRDIYGQTAAANLFTNFTI